MKKGVILSLSGLLIIGLLCIAGVYHRIPVHRKSSAAFSSMQLSSSANIKHSYQSKITGPLRHSSNTNYFEDANGKPVLLCGSQTWNTLQDWGTNGKVQPLDFDAFVNFLKKYGHNFTLLWFTELPVFRNLPITETNPPDFTVSPFPWKRTGPGLATDGELKFDLTQFNDEFFERLKTRVSALNEAGIDLV